jgi:Domain of unknown function (DUF4188)
MANIISARVCAEIDGPFVLFLIGVRINRLLAFNSWVPTVRAMGPMVRELMQQPQLGLLHARTHFGFPDIMLVQYWRSHDHLQAFATARDQLHLPAWQRFNTAIGSNGDVGIWHETYLIQPGQYENVYNNMPAWGMGLAGTIHEAVGPRARAEGRRAIQVRNTQT